jgi:hypothetical protein
LEGVLCLTIADQGAGEILLAGWSRNGILRSVDAGATWEPAEILLS